MPILIHGGRGLPPIAEDLEALVRRNEGVQLIVAHAGIADMAGLAGRLGGLPGVFFDTSVWSGLDLLDLYRQIAPEQVIYASDYPYGRQPNSLLVAVRTAKLAGFDDKQLRLMLGGSARRMIAGEELEPLSAPKGPTSLVQPLTFARIHQYISMAVPMLWLRQRDAIGALGLAVNASRERSNGHPEASERIEELLGVAQDLWRGGTEIEDGDERVATFRAAIQLVNLADMVSLTTRASRCREDAPRSVDTFEHVLTAVLDSRPSRRRVALVESRASRAADPPTAAPRLADRLDSRCASASRQLQALGAVARRARATAREAVAAYDSSSTERP